MDSNRTKFFTTDQVATLLDLESEDKWRVTKFVQSREYGIKPSISEAAGTGSRRLYDIENVCEIALALRLLETGLRPNVIGHVLQEVRRDGVLSRYLKITKDQAWALYLGIFVSPQKGKPLDVSRVRHIDFFEGFMEVENRIGQIAAELAKQAPGLVQPPAYLPGIPSVDELTNYDVLLVAVGLMFYGINERIQTMESGSVGGKH
jgi:DNA-binding transcriptional MerR regulator